MKIEQYSDWYQQDPEAPHLRLVAETPEDERTLAVLRSVLRSRRDFFCLTLPATRRMGRDPGELVLCAVSTDLV